MHRFLFPLLFLVSSFFCRAQPARLDTLIPHLMREAAIPGLSIAVIEGGEATYRGAFGVRSVDTQLPVDEQTVFAAASLSKPVFAYAVLKLADAGAIDLDKPLYQYLPYPDIAYDDRYRQITARMVMSHRSGFPNWRRDSLVILFTPGERYSYSGEGFVYLQKVVEKITAKPLDVWMREQVFAPLGMNRTSYVWQPAFDDNFALPHDELGKTQGKFRPDEGNTAHSLQTTAADYARFLVAALAGKGLKEKTAREMLTPQVRLPEKARQADSLHATLSWGLGWGLEESTEGRYFWQWGDNGTFKAFVMANRQAQTGIVYFANSSNGLSMVQDLLAATPAGDRDACAWLNYASYSRPAFQLMQTILAEGYQAAIQPFLAPDGLHHDTTRLTERDLNEIGYALLRQKHLEEARQAFRSNLLAYPYSANVYDSYAEACLMAGDRKAAAQNYETTARLNPTNEVARRIADQLTQPMSGNTTFRLEGYPNARLVSLAGEFNDWAEWKNIMRREDGAWVCRLDLTPGTYRYKFVVDGIWILDPGNPSSTYDGHHNSVIEIK